MDNQECLDQAGLWSRSARIMTLACLIVFMAQMATTVYLPSLPVVMTDLAMTRQGAELSISLFVIGAALPVLFWGAAADRYGRRLPLALSLLLFVGLSLLLATHQPGAAALDPAHPARGSSRRRGHHRPHPGAGSLARG